MLLFSGKLKLHFQTLSQGNMRHLKLAATWAESEWGYIRNKGVPFRMKVLEEMKDQVYIGTIDPLQVDMLHRSPVAMFALLNHTTDFLEQKQDECKMLMYVYVEPSCRGLGFGKQIIEKAKSLAKKSGATLLVLDTLNPRLNHLYEKYGAKVICEGRLFSEPTDMLSIRL